MFLTTFRDMSFCCILGVVTQNWPKIFNPFYRTQSKMIKKERAFALPFHVVCPIIMPRATRDMNRRQRLPVIVSIALFTSLILYPPTDPTEP